MWKIIVGICVVFVVVMVGINMSYQSEKPKQDFKKLADTENIKEELETEGKTLGFKNNGNLLTNTSITSIPLQKVLAGCPRKDCIPAIDSPEFISVTEASKIEEDDELGISVSINGIDRFYPYTIMVWHEIVNDTFGDVPVLVTFCPLCGSAIVYDPVVNGVRERFGVSGKLFESNLLMYDYSTETLWSQARAEAVVGDRIGERLPILDSDLITFAEFKNRFPNGDVLSRKTGHTRNYGFYPYGDYETNNDTVIFPVTIDDTRLPTKTLMYIVPTEHGSYAFHRENLLNSGVASLTSDSETVSVKVIDGNPVATDINGNELPGYIEMWFSWVQHHEDDGVVWKG